METEIIYYQLWTNEMQYTFEEKFYIHSKLTYGKADEFYFAVNIAENNRQFLKALKKKMKENYQICDMWLRGLISIYVKRQANRHKTEYKAEYYNEWINNTLHIIQGKNYTEIEKWCNNYKKYIIDYYTDADKKKQPQQNIIPDIILTALQKNGFIADATEIPSKWLKSKSLLAYFVDVANDKFNLKKGLKRQIKPFETLFNVSGLGGSINDYHKTGDLPIGHNDIDELFR